MSTRPPPPTVYLIRAGATTYDEQDRLQGVLDVPLSERGQAEAEELAASLEAASLEALYCGPGQSVFGTAEIIGRRLGLRVRRLDEMRNLDQGLWQGLQREEIKRRNLRLYRQWLEDPSTVCPPGGETVSAALDRLRSALKPLLKRHHDETVGLVVREPIALLVEGLLMADPRPHFSEVSTTGRFVKIEPRILTNGRPAPPAP